MANTTTANTDDRAADQARAQVEDICDLIAQDRKCNAALDAGEDWDYSEHGDPTDRIHEKPLSVQVRTGWHNPYCHSDSEWQYEILLCTGGPAVRIVGDLDQWREPDTARVEYQDWGTPWTEWHQITDEQKSDVLEFATRFYYGEAGR